MALFIKVKDTNFKVGDTIAIHQKIKEGEKSRIQIFEGFVIAIKNSKNGRMFTVRKISDNQIGVERIWNINSPSIEKIEVKKTPKVRRAKLYFIRNRKGKEAKEI